LLLPLHFRVSFFFLIEFKDSFQYFFLHPICFYFFTSLRHFFYHRNVHISECCNSQCSWNWCCSHVSNIRMYTFFTQCFSLLYTKTMLFINNNKSQFFK